MRSDYTGYITSAEWRWVIIVGSVFVTLAFVPFLWALVAVGTSEGEWEFMGALHGYRDTSTDLMRITQGAEGQWVTQYLHTPESHDGTLAGIFYTSLGHVARVTSLSPMVIYHIVRIGVSLFMYLSFYQLAANIWMRIRPRRVFFVMLSVGSGFGWILSPLTGDTSFIDLTTPGAFPFASTLVNIHFPLAMACLALIADVIIVMFRPGMTENPTVQNGGAVVFLLSMILIFVYPPAIIPFALAFAACLLIYWYSRREIDKAQLYWFMWFGVPALPMVLYYAAVMKYNPLVAEIWSQQSLSPRPSLIVLLLSFGLPLWIAMPGIYRAVRRFEPDGDRLMLVWMIVIVISIYSPTHIQQDFAFAIMIPIIYFATRSVEDFWFDLVRRRKRQIQIFVALIPLLAAGNFFVASLPLYPIVDGDFDEAPWLVLQHDYIRAFNWLESNADSGDVILAAPDVSLWIPARTGKQVVYGHPQQTANAIKKELVVLGWYAETELDECGALLQGEYSFEGDYTVKYIVFGPHERKIGESVCIDLLMPVRSFGDVQIFSYDVDSSADR